MNALIKIHVMSIDTFTNRKFKIQKQNDWRGENSGEISVTLTWDESFKNSLFSRSSEEDIKEAAIDLIRKIPSEMKSEEQKNKLKDKLSNEYGFLPQDVDELLNQFEMIPALTKKDASEINTELSRQLPSPMKTIFTNIPLWPYMERKLNEIDDAHVITGFSSLCIQEGLPNSIANEFITHLDILSASVELFHKVFQEAEGREPFHRIFNFYKEHGGTYGGWISAFEKVRDHLGWPTKQAFKNEESRRQVMDCIMSRSMYIYNQWYKRWEEKYENLTKLITNFDEFADKFKSHGISNFQKMGIDDLKSQLQVADQIWLFREKFGGYAHVLFYLGRFIHHDNEKTGDPHHYVVHVHQNIGFQTYKGNARIQQDKLEDVINKNARSFIVRMPNLSTEGREKAQKRALACVNTDEEPIIFSYNGYSGNCESCVNAFYGLWDDEVTSQQGNEVASGSASQTIKTIAKTLVFVTKRGSDDDLRDKIKERFRQQKLDT